MATPLSSSSNQLEVEATRMVVQWLNDHKYFKAVEALKDDCPLAHEVV